MELRLMHDGVPVTILAGPYVAAGAPTPEALTFVRSLVDRLDEFRRYAARKELLRLYNTSWLDENHKALDEDGFVANLTNPTVTVMDEVGAATVYFDDGDMFAGHLVEVFLNKGELFAGIIG
jgi:hypothetical protein